MFKIGRTQSRRKPSNLWPGTRGSGSTGLPSREPRRVSIWSGFMWEQSQKPTRGRFDSTSVRPCGATWPERKGGSLHGLCACVDRSRRFSPSRFVSDGPKLKTKQKKVQNFTQTPSSSALAEKQAHLSWFGSRPSSGRLRKRAQHFVLLKTANSCFVHGDVTCF